MSTKYRKRRAPLSALLPKVIYMHVMDSTDGIPGNLPKITFTTNKKNPFGKPGRDYSESYPWTCTRFVPDVSHATLIGLPVIDPDLLDTSKEAGE